VSCDWLFFKGKNETTRGRSKGGWGGSRLRKISHAKNQTRKAFLLMGKKQVGWQSPYQYLKGREDRCRKGNATKKGIAVRSKEHQKNLARAGKMESTASRAPDSQNPNGRSAESLEGATAWKRKLKKGNTEQDKRGKCPKRGACTK